jgi:hypothetical protein
MNPVTRQIEPKSTYLLQPCEDLIVGCGIQN